MIKKILIAIAITAISLNCFAGFNEKHHQEKWCKEHNGLTEFRTYLNTRIDCITSQHAIEFDFAPKFNEAIGQALGYGLTVNKKPGIVLIIRDYEKEMKYVQMLVNIIVEYSLPISVWFIIEEEPI